MFNRSSGENLLKYQLVLYIFPDDILNSHDHSVLQRALILQGEIDADYSSGLKG